MSSGDGGPRKPREGKLDAGRLDEVVRAAQQARLAREQDYRAQSLKIHPWVCGRCGREFTRENLHLLTVHHKDHNHDNNPPDGSNWENLCIYCHDNEHARYLDHAAGGGSHAPDKAAAATHNPFASLKDLLKDD
ncbi:HNH nuclease family protein [Ectothiorhodospiraceae bacterium 2226]|nr:HNH nuclease family protein [Ectothiorhodospiraceae bacterium 2226]